MVPCFVKRWLASRISRQHLMTASTPTGLLVLAMLVGQAAGFASSLGGYHAADPVDGGCTDTSNVVMSGITGGKTCADLAAEGRCASTDDLVKTVMEKNCMASCGACGPTRESRAYVQNGGAEGDWVLKEYIDGYAYAVVTLDESQAASKLCGAGTEWKNGKCEYDRVYAARRLCGTSCGEAHKVHAIYCREDWNHNSYECRGFRDSDSLPLRTPIP